MRHGKENPNWKGGPVKKTCAHCGCEFVVERARAETAKYCSRKCLAIEAGNKGRAVRSAKASYHWRKERKRRFSNKDFAGPYTRLALAPRCGHLTRKGRAWCEVCNPKNSKSLKRVCVTCGAEFDVKYPSQTSKTCSFKCERLHRANKQRGEKSHRWDGGKTEENRILRNGLQAKIWREQVFARDDYTCVKCGARGGQLTADHIKPWSLYPALRFDLENGRTLCRECHGNEPTTGGKLTRLLNLERKQTGGIQLRLL